MKVKQAISVSDSIRIFKLQNLNLEAKVYIEIITWNTSTLTPMPLSRTLINEEIKQYVRNDFKHFMSTDAFPRHTEAVEEVMYSHSSRDGYFRTTVLSRSALPNVSHKSEF